MKFSMTRIFSEARKADRKIAIKIFVSSVITIVSETIINVTPIIFMALIQKGFFVNKLFKYAILLLLVNLLSLCAKAFFNTRFEIHTHVISEKLKEHFFCKTINTSYEIFRNQQFRANFNNAIFSIDNQSLFVRYFRDLNSLLQSILNIFVVLIFLKKFSIYPLLIGILMIIISIPIYLSERKLQDKRTSNLLSVNKGLNYYGTIILDPNFSYDNAIYGYSDFMIDRYDSYIRDINKVMGRDKTKIALLKWFGSIVPIVCIIITAFGIKQMALKDKYHNGVITVSMFTIVFALNNLLSSFSKVSIVSNQLQSFLDFIDNIKDNHRANQKKPELYSNYELVKIDQVDFSYNGLKDTISDLSLTINKGEVLAIVGENGSGKTTLVLLIAGLLNSSRGSIKYKNGLKISYVQQKSIEFPETILSNTVLNHSVILDRLRRCYDIVNLREWIESLKDKEHTLLNNNVNKSGIGISGGQFQRLSIARGLYLDSDILVLDEPTASLDIENENQIFKNLINNNDICTKVFISHRLANCTLATRIIYLKDGEIVEEGTHQELMQSQGEYYKLFSKQSKLYSKSTKTIL